MSSPQTSSRALPEVGDANRGGHSDPAATTASDQLSGATTPSIVVSTDDLSALLHAQGHPTEMDYLKLPKCPKMHLISPPGSPPLGWEQVEEDHPNPDPLAMDLHADAFVLPPPSSSSPHPPNGDRAASPSDPLIAAVSAKLAALSAFKSGLSTSPTASPDHPSAPTTATAHVPAALKLRSSTLGRPSVTTASPATLMTARNMYSGSPAPDSPIDFSLGSPAVRSTTPGMHQLWLGRSGSTSDTDDTKVTLSPPLNATQDTPHVVTESPALELSEPAWPVPLSNSPTAMSSLPPGSVTVIVPGISDAQHAKQRTLSLSMLSASPTSSNADADGVLARATEDATAPVPMIVVQDHSAAAADISDNLQANGGGPQRSMSLPVPGRPLMAVPFPPSSAMSKASSIPQTRLPPRTAASPKE